MTQFWVGNLSSPEEKADFNFVAFIEEFVGLAELNLQIVFTDFKAETNLLDLNRFLVAAAAVLLLGLLVTILAPIKQLSDRWIGVGSDLC